jgi:GT2 family glycosyltransferase
MLRLLTHLAPPMSSAPIPLVSVVIPVHNGGNAFRRCLKALQNIPAVAEIIVVSDGESDGSWRVAQEFGTRLIRLNESKGPARARNIGAAAATGDILFFVDADVEVHANTVAQVADSFARDPQLAALIGSYDDAPGAPNFLSQYKNLLHHYTHQTACLDASTFWGACGAIRRSIFQVIGGFDERYRRPCIEDIELGYRLKQAGYKIHLRKDIQVKHLKRWTPLSLLRADFFYRALPWMALLLQVRQQSPAQYERFTRDLNLKWSSRLSVMLVYVLLLAVAIAPFYPAGIVVSALFGLALTLINLPVYDFFRRKCGWFFALRTVPWHWFYFLYSGLAYMITLVRHQLRLYPSS